MKQVILGGVFVSVLCLSSFASEEDRMDLSLLKDGNQRYINRSLLHKDSWDKPPSLRPSAVVVSCSDSELVPEIVFDQKPGQLITLQLPAEILDSHAITQIEYAIKKLEVKLVLILGHDSCEAIRFAFADDPSIESPSITIWKKEVISGIRRFKGTEKGDPLFHTPAKANVYAVAKNLIQKSKIVQESIKKGDLKIIQGIFTNTNGKVDLSEDVGPLYLQLIQSKELKKTEEPQKQIQKDAPALESNPWNKKGTSSKASYE